MSESFIHLVAAGSQGFHLDLGDLPTWVGVGAAIAAALAAGWQLNGQRREFARQGRILERQQANHVDFSWIRAQAQDINLQTHAGPLPPAERSVWIVTNASRRPIHDVTCGISVAVPGQPKQTFNPERVGQLRPGEPPIFDPYRDTKLPLVRASTRFGFLFQYPIAPGGYPSEETNATLQFTDDAGLKWQIDQDLHLSRRP
jgi:hypothetical protein